MKYGNYPVWKRFFYSPVGIVLAFIIFVLIARGAWGVHKKALLAKERLIQAQEELVDLNKQQQSLSASISQLSTTEGIEAALREKYHAVKQGESVAVIIDSSDSDNASGSTSDDISTSSSTDKISWWGSILQFIGF